LIPVGFGYRDGDEFFLRGWVWDSETRPRPVAIPTRSGREKKKEKKMKDKLRNFERGKGGKKIQFL